MSDPQPPTGEHDEEALPPGVDEPGTEEPEADALEQQLLPESGEAADEEIGSAPPGHDESTTPAEANDADAAEQARTVEHEDDEYGE